MREETIGSCRLILGDAREILPGITCDALVTDPPYGLGGEKWRGGKGEWPLKELGNGMAWDAKSLSWLKQEVLNFKHAIVWGGNYYDLPPRRGWLIWDKIVRNFTSGHAELAWTTLDQPVRAFSYAHGALASEGKLHPTQKPLPLMRWCISMLPADVGSICDPFAGSFTTGVVCAERGIAFVGLEQEPRYFEIGLRRIEAVYRQADLFRVAPSETAPQQPSLLPALKEAAHA